MVVLFRTFAVMLLVGAVAEFILFVARVPALWVSDYSERLTERPAMKLSKANMNRGDFLIYFIAWVLRSRIRAAAMSVLTGYAGWCMWTGRPLIPTLLD